jgi:hypothetical protein
MEPKPPRPHPPLEPSDPRPGANDTRGDLPGDALGDAQRGHALGAAARVVRGGENWQRIYLPPVCDEIRSTERNASTARYVARFSAVIAARASGSQPW